MTFSGQLITCDANTGDSYITCTENHVSSHFGHYGLMNAMVPLTTALASQIYV